MPVMDPNDQPVADPSADQLDRLPFPPVTYSHIMNCSYHAWQPQYVFRSAILYYANCRSYRSFTPKSRVIPVNKSFVDYLRADGIVLPPEDHVAGSDDDDDWNNFSDDDDEGPDPSIEWADIHTQVKNTVAEFGKATPKLNWSAPKDATFMSATNDLQCSTASDIYLLLKSSDFITHDLEHAFDGCVPDAGSSTEPEVPYHLILRKYVNINPALEFRCFVRDRVLLCISQRDPNHFDFLFPLRDTLRGTIQKFFDEKLKDTFPDPNFVFDVYIPAPHQRVWLVDVNPWADRTDPLLFSWLEVLNMKDPISEQDYNDLLENGFVRLSFNDNNNSNNTARLPLQELSDDSDTESESDLDSQADDSGPFLPEFRLVRRDDPEAYAFSSTQYSAHKLPREVVDASLAGPGGMKEFMGRWQDILAKDVDGQVTSSDDE